MRKALCMLCLLGLAARAVGAAADTVQLKGRSAITGTILAEKRDAVVVDLGYTVLVIPRQQVSRIIRGSDRAGRPPDGEDSLAVAPTVAESETSIAPAAAAGSDFYTTAPSASPLRNVRELAAQLGEAVVQVKTPSSLGSGFIINEDGFLLTNFHIIEGETQISVEVYHQRNGQWERQTYKQVRIVALNRFEDLALLQIQDAPGRKFPFVQLGSSDSLAVGERVFAIGSPLGLERTVTEGIVSTKTRQLQGKLYLQTTTQINPGNSGGPLFDLRGRVVGITNMKITFGEGLGFAIPVETARFFLDHREAYAYANDNPANAYRYLEPPSRSGRPAATQ